MQMIQFSTRKGNFILLKVPKKGNYTCYAGMEETTVWYVQPGVPKIKDHDIIKGRWEYLDEAFSPLVDKILHRVIPTNFWGAVRYGGQKYKDRKDAWFNGCLPALEVYQYNPVGPDPCSHDRNCTESCQGSCWPEDMDFDEWEYAEFRTGTWLLLKKM